MTLKACIAAMSLAAAVTAAAPAFAGVSIVQAPSPVLARGATYVWGSIALAMGAPAPAVVNEITVERLQTATETTLSAKGLRRVDDPAQADLVLAYHMITANRLDANLNDMGPRGPFFHGDYSVSTSQSTEGTLVMDLIERNTGRLVYRATAEKEISARDAEPKRLDSLLKDMTRQLPAQ